MAHELNEDICTLVFDHVHDFACLQATIEAVSISKTSCLRDVLFRRLLQRPLRLSSDAMDGTEPLIELLLNKFHTDSRSAERIQRIELSLGPSRNANFDDDPRRLMIKQASRLVEMLPRLFSVTTNLRHLTWTKIPLPDEKNLQVLAALPHLESISVDCATGLWSGRNMDNRDEYWVIEPLFKTLGPKLISLDLRNVNEDIFHAMCNRFSAFTKLQNLKMDITCGCWDWDGRGSPQQGPSPTFVFPRIGKNIRSFGLIVSDNTVSPLKTGPLDLVDPKSLEELVLYVNHCYAWTTISGIKLFQTLLPVDYKSLVHLELRDDVWDGTRWTWGAPNTRNYNEFGRAYFGIHEFICTLPALRHLWVDERVLVVPKDTSDQWDAYRYGEEDEKRTLNSPQWGMLAQTFEKLESLRVGFGPMDLHWLGEVLKLCNPKLLKKFGFDWNWRRLGKEQGIPLEVFKKLAEFPYLTDVHVLHPRPELGDDKFDEITLANVQQIFEECSSVVYVGVGRNVVWERKTPWHPDETLAQLLSNGRSMHAVPRFFDAGSSQAVSPGAFEELELEGISKENRGLLDWLKQCSKV